MRYFSLFLLAVVVYSCNQGPKHVNQIDTAIVAYQQNGQYIFNKALVWTHIGRKFVSDSGLQAEMGQITQFSLRLPTTKADSIIDSATHRLIRVKDSYPIVYLPDSLSHYIHIIDTLHIK